MTGVDANLATLRRRITNYASVAQDHEGLEALARVEAELSRLREERDEAQQDRNEYIDIAEREGARCARLQQALLTSYVCEECGRLGLISEFGDDCKPGWTHGRLVKVRSVGEALAGPDTSDYGDVSVIGDGPHDEQGQPIVDTGPDTPADSRDCICIHGNVATPSCPHCDSQENKT